MKFRRKTGIVEAKQWFPDVKIDGVKLTAPDRGSLVPRGILRTSFGNVLVNSGDWIVTGELGERWVVESGTFPLYYEAVSVDEALSPG